MSWSQKHWDSSAPVSPGLSLLARIWAGNGSLLDWLAPNDWDVSLAWSREDVELRVLDTVLRQFDLVHASHLPRFAEGWLELLAPILNGLRHESDQPTPATDWQATLSAFGVYPSQRYINRRSVLDFDTPFTRLLGWVSESALAIDTNSRRLLGRASLSQQVVSSFRSASELREVGSATKLTRPSSEDLDTASRAGNVWKLLARLARQIDATKWGSLPTQIASLAPVLPDFDHQLFELETLGMAVTGINAPGCSWKTRTPLGASRRRLPCLSAVCDRGTVDLYFQTLPDNEAYRGGVYSELAGVIGAGKLRPDMLLSFGRDGRQLDVVIECKFTNDAGYAASGVAQSMSYATEYNARNLMQVFFTVAPPSIVGAPFMWGRKFGLASPAHLETFCARVMTASWEDALGSLPKP